MPRWGGACWSLLKLFPVDLLNCGIVWSVFKGMLVAVRVLSIFYQPRLKVRVRNDNLGLKWLISSFWIQICPQCCLWVLLSIIPFQVCFCMYVCSLYGFILYICIYVPVTFVCLYFSIRVFGWGLTCKSVCSSNGSVCVYCSCMWLLSANPWTWLCWIE